VQCPHNPLTEDYIEIFYMIHEGDIPSIQCKMSLRGPKSMRKVDDLSLVFSDFYVPALTPRSSSIETSLRLSENIIFFAVCRIYAGVFNKETWAPGVLGYHKRIYMYTYCKICGISSPQAFLNFNVGTNFRVSHSKFFPVGFPPQMRADWTLVSTDCSWLSSHTS
jgi:hypothetical protein